MTDELRAALSTSPATEGRLLPEDLITDHALEANDPDTLRHKPIADRAAELALSSRTPTNIALFGAWGSGKSSFARLLEASLEDGAAHAERPESAKLIRYVAWTFEGESLRRNLISSAAADLGLPEADYPEFYSGLYEKTQSGRIRLKPDEIRRWIRWAVGIGAVVVLALAGLAAVIALILGQDVVRALIDTFGAILPAAAVVGLLVSGARELLASGRVQVDVSPPTQEQLRATFKSLIRAGLKQSNKERLVFFVDELDRCRPGQVVEVLAAIRHFYDEPGCVFVVAADRDVIEEALDREAEQTNPLNVDNPYYSSASEYIDKVFQHQLSLPPLRGRRLTRFARDLVSGHATGLWSTIEAVDGGRLRDQLMYVLVPSHVRSPRRVKVLLNNFATSFRIAQSRGLDALGDALALAKLVALRTEFPGFAADLVHEPRIPTFVLDPNQTTSPRAQRLIAKHQLPKAEDVVQVAPTASPDGEEPQASPTDRPLLVGKDARGRIAHAQRVLLRRYLVRTQQFPNPSRELIYLEPSGATVDLADNEFGEEIDTYGTEDPQRVVRMAAEKPPEDVRKALLILADMAAQEFGEERANAVSSLLGLAQLLKHDVSPFETEVLGAIELQQSETGLDASQLVPALALTLRAGHALAGQIVADARLLADAERVKQVAVQASSAMAGADRARVWERVLELHEDDPQVIPDLFESLPPDMIVDLVRMPDTKSAAARFGPVMRGRLNELTESAALEEVQSWFDALLGREDDVERAVGHLLLRLVDDSTAGNSYAASVVHEEGFRQDDGPSTLWISPWAGTAAESLPTLVGEVQWRFGRSSSSVLPSPCFARPTSSSRRRA